METPTWLQPTSLQVSLYATLLHEVIDSPPTCFCHVFFTGCLGRHRGKAYATSQLNSFCGQAGMEKENGSVANY